MNEHSYPNDQTIKIPGVTKPVPIGSITHCKGDGNYTRVYLQGLQKPIIATQTLKLFESQLPNFLRVSKSTLINHQYIESIDRQPGGILELYMTNASSVAVSRRRKQDIWNKLNQLTQFSANNTN
jgi:DNA-binding LytR/AlgR family response regulator